MMVKMGKLILFLLILVFILAQSGLALKIEPTSQSVELFTNAAKNAFVNITNDGNQSIYLVTLTSDNPDISYVDNVFNLTAGESKEVKLVIDTEATYLSTSKVNIVYYKKVDVILQPEDKIVNIDNLDFQPDKIEVIAGSKITWINKDSLTHSVTSKYFDQDLASNASFSYTFTTSEVISYYDKFTNYGGSITVIGTSGTDYAHNPNEDRFFSIDIKSKRVETELTVDLIDGINFTIEANSQKDSVLLIKNTGAVTAQNIKLSGEWLNFGKQDFFIAPGEQTYITFTIIPQILSSSETNKTYFKDILVYSNNSLDIIKNLSIYVPFKGSVSVNDTISKMFNQTISEDFLIAMHNTVCKANPEYVYCKPEIREVIVYQSPPIPYNYTQEDVGHTIRRQAEIDAKLDRVLEDINAKIDSIKDDTSTASDSTYTTKNAVNQLLAQEAENNKELRNIYYLIIVGIIIVGLILGGYFGITGLTKRIEYKKVFDS